MNVLLLLGFSLFICQIQSATVSIGRHFSSSFDNYNNNEMNSLQGNDPENLNRNKREGKSASLGTAGRVLISQIGQKFVSAEEDEEYEIIDRTGTLDTSGSKERRITVEGGMALGGSAVAGAAFGGAVGTAIAPGVGTIIGGTIGGITGLGLVGKLGNVFDN